MDEVGEAFAFLLVQAIKPARSVRLKPVTEEHPVGIVLTIDLTGDPALGNERPGESTKARGKTRGLLCVCRTICVFLLDAVGSDVSQVLGLRLEEGGLTKTGIALLGRTKETSQTIGLGGGEGGIKERLIAELLLTNTHLIPGKSRLLTLGVTLLTHVIGVQDFKVGTLTAELEATGLGSSSGGLLSLFGLLGGKTSPHLEIGENLATICAVDALSDGIKGADGCLCGLLTKPAKHTQLTCGVLLLELLGRLIELTIEAKHPGRLTTEGGKLTFRQLRLETAFGFGLEAKEFLLSLEGIFALLDVLLIVLFYGRH